MGNQLYCTVANLSDDKIFDLSEAVSLWLAVSSNFERTCMPSSHRTLLNELVIRFRKDLLRQRNKARYVASDTVRKNKTRKELQEWFSTTFQPFIWRNKQYITNNDLLAMGWHARPIPRRVVPAPRDVVLFLRLRAINDGCLFIMATGEGKSLGKPKDVEGVELEYTYEDPRHQGDTAVFALGRYTRVREEIRVVFPEKDYGRQIWVRGRWYNKQGYSAYSAIVTTVIQTEQ